MPILPGRRLGPYEILSAIGAGGMGEVYKARDTRLDRIVAIKVLPTHLADRSELRERFEREAKTIASLNHPHICTLYDTGHQDKIDFLVMEYLEGETLAQRLRKGSLPIQQVLQYAIEIADALDKAHRKGITHRDLKPGNIMLTKSGTKLLDFGLAKLKQDAAPATPESQLPTMKSAITGEGTILGTLQYMAPEQVEAKEVDARTDIFAFGAVVYEMATGKKAFEGKTSASVMAKILEADPPPMSSLQPLTPPALDRVVKRCLAKDPDKRWQSASDLGEELKWIAEGGSQAGVPAAATAGGTSLTLRSVLSSAVVSLIVAAFVGLAVWNLKPSLPRAVSRFTIALPPGQQLAALDVGPALALSPDGAHLAYVARQSGTQRLYLRVMDSLEAKPIPGTEGASWPFFSPDGQWLGFFGGDGRLQKVSISGGPTLALCYVTGSVLRGVTWGSDDTIVFGTNVGTGLFVVPAAGGTPQPLTALDSKKNETSHRYPQFLPSAKAILFNPSGTLLALYVLKTGERRDLIQGGGSPHYAPTRHLIYAQAGTLMAVPFDPQRLAVTGSSIPIVEGVMQSANPQTAQYSFSENGALVYVPGGIQRALRRLVWVDRKGAEQPIAAPPHSYGFPRVSPDGRRVALATDGKVWIYDLGRETLTPLTTEGGGTAPIWTPDGKRVVFFTGAPQGNLFWQAADGSSKSERLTTNQYPQVPSSWSPDGQVLAFIENNPTTRLDLWILRLSDRKPQPFLRTPYNEAVPRFSPDGRWLAYVSDESGRYEVYMQPYPGPGGKSQISTDGGTEPVWNPNGRELFYRSGDKMMAVDITTQASVSAGKPRMLFEGPYVPTGVTHPNYDISPDGQRFLMIKQSEQESAPTQVNVVLNWFEELKQKVPMGKK